MVRADVLTLIAEQPDAHGVFDNWTPSTRTVYCTIKSVTRAEAYAAMSAGLAPSIVFVLADYAEYKNEKICEYKGQRYRIIRSYVKAQSIELTAEALNNGRADQSPNGD